MTCLARSGYSSPSCALAGQRCTRVRSKNGTVIALSREDKLGNFFAGKASFDKAGALHQSFSENEVERERERESTKEHIINDNGLIELGVHGGTKADNLLMMTNFNFASVTCIPAKDYLRAWLYVSRSLTMSG